MAIKIDFNQTELRSEQKQILQQLRRQCEVDILTSVTLATCGHPGGSLSSLDALLMLYAMARIDLKTVHEQSRDRIIVSHGHISPAVYAVLCAFGFDDRHQFVAHFRQAGSRFGGHVETHVPGVEWNTGNLGQGLSAATASAWLLKSQQSSAKSFVLMGDGEQQKGQIAEARRFACKYGLGHLCVLIDANGLQIGGKTDDVMPTPIAQEYETAGFLVEVIDGHDWDALFVSLRRFYMQKDPKKPTALILKTVMGKGVAFMENKHHYHGSAPSLEQIQTLFSSWGESVDFKRLLDLRNKTNAHLEAAPIIHDEPKVQIKVAKPMCYEQSIDNRSAYGNVLKSLAEDNNTQKNITSPRVFAVSCDLEGSVKMSDFRQVSPDCFIETGISEHHAAVFSGRLAKEGQVVFFSTFGAFAVAETYNQQRLSDYNQAPVKVVATHCGLDVGEDGPTHQSIDYISLMSNLFNFEIFVPADPNQTDRVIRYVAGSQKPAFVAMGRSKLPIIKNTQGQPFWGDETPFVPGSYDQVRLGQDGSIIVMGTLTKEAVLAHDLIKQQHGLSFAVYVVASIKPFSLELVRQAAQTKRIITVEDHHRDTGLGSLVANALTEQALSARLVRLGVTHYAHSGASSQLYAQMGLDAQSICQTAKKLFVES